MNRSGLTVLAVILGAAALVAYLTLFTVSQTQQALVLEFGKPKRVIADPGLQYKIPFIQNVEFFDKRILDIDTASQEVIASDKKRLVVDAFARYRITDPLLFFQTLRDERIASARIGAILEASLRRVLGGSSFTSVVRDKRESLMKAIYRRMQTERQREAAEFRAEGEGAARRIRATADREVTVIKAEATGESERIRGAGDAERNRIFAEAFGQDPDFFAFYRSMQAYEGSMRPGDTRMLLSPNSQFFQYFDSAFGKAGQHGAPPPSTPATPPGSPSGTGTPEQGGAGANALVPPPDTAAGDTATGETAAGDTAPPAPETP
jgi:modulator of FtsH protease HflC